MICVGCACTRAVADMLCHPAIAESGSSFIFSRTSRHALSATFSGGMLCGAAFLSDLPLKSIGLKRSRRPQYAL